MGYPLSVGEITGGKRPAFEDEPTVQAGPAYDSEPTVKALPEEPTLSGTAQHPDEPTVSVRMDIAAVQAAFAEQDATIPGATAPPVNEHEVASPLGETLPDAVSSFREKQDTQPLMDLAAMPFRSAQTLPMTERPMEPWRDLDIRAAMPSVPNESESGPDLPSSRELRIHQGLAEAPSDDVSETPGLDRRRRMRRIVVGILSACALVCAGAAAVQLSALSVVPTTAPALPKATESAVASAIFVPIAPTTTSPTPSALASASASASAPAPAPPPVRTVLAAPVARPTTIAQPRPAAPPKPPPRDDIVRSSPF